MCGRKTLTEDLQSIIEELAIQEWEDPDNYIPSYNIAPTQTSPILIDDGIRRVELMRWGLIPSWSKDMSFGARMINARAETLLEKPSFHNLVPNRRCVVITDGYYEWRKEISGKQPYYIHHPDGRLLPMAGLWDKWSNQEGKQVLSYTVITTKPQSELAFIHDRMPVILHRENLDQWLQTANNPAQTVLPLLQSYRGMLEAYTVSKMVNSPANNSPACTQPLS
ncbi:MAG: SOS response-associated peptidase [Candidatus Marinimicrobia bacterium]|nr:SOS response-associated peptidase [Candidatus Neomarinimicrobiota bacterium]